MSRKLFAMLLICLLAFTATGCRLTSPGGDEGATTLSSTVVKTVIKKPAAGSANMLGNLRAGIRPQVTTETVTGATVVMTLSDGRTFTMTDNGNGEYTATVSGLEGAKGFIIEARKGDLLVQNMVNDLKNTDLSNLQSDHTTTAFAQVAISAAKVLATTAGIQVATLDDLIKNVTKIEIELVELKKQVTDENNIAYEKSRKMVTIAQANADLTKETAAAGGTILEKIIAGDLTGLDAISTKLKEEQITSWQENVTKAIQNGDIALPTVAPEEDKTKIKAAMDAFMLVFLKIVSNQAITEADTVALSGVLDSEFVLRGLNKEKLLIVKPDAQGDLDRFVGEPVLSKLDDNTYLVNIRGTAYMKNGKTQAIDSTLDGYIYNPKDPKAFTARALSPKVSEFPVIVRKQTDGSWKIYGNRTKIDEVNMDLQYVLDMNAKKTRTQLYFEVLDTATFGVSAVTVRGGQIGNTEVALKKDPKQTDSNSWKYFYTHNNIEQFGPYPSPANLWDDATNKKTHATGDAYTFKVTFSDGSIQEYTHKVPAIPAGYGPLTESSVKLTFETNKLKIEWPKNTFANFEDYEVTLWKLNENAGRVLESKITDVNTTSAEFAFKTTSYELIPGQQYSINFHSNLDNGLNQHVHYWFTMPDPKAAEAQQASGLAKALDNGLKVVANGAGAIPFVTFPSASMRASSVTATAMIPPLPANTQYYSAYTAYTGAGSLTNIFAMPTTAFAGLDHLLIRFRDSNGNFLAYDATNKLTGQPAKMDMLAVYNSTQNGANIKMQLGMENHPLISNDQATLAFQGIGTVTAQLNDGSNLEVRITDSMFGRRASGSDGHSLKADLFVNGQPFTIGGKVATLIDGAYTANGLYAAKIMLAGETTPGATLERVGGKLYLKIPGQADLDLGQ